MCDLCKQSECGGECATNDQLSQIMDLDNAMIPIKEGD